MAEQETNPTRESGPRTDWDIGKAMNSFFSPGEAVATDEAELDAEEAPIEGTASDDEDAVDDEASGGDEDADPDDEGTSDEPFLTLTVNGKSVPVGSKEEAIKLAQMGTHYTQEMQKLRDAEARLASEHEQRSAKLDQSLNQYATALQTISETYGFVLGQQPPDWSSPEMQKLKAEKPEEYVAIREQWDQLGSIRSELQRVARETQDKQQKQWQAWVTREQAALAEKRPEWTDAAKRTQDFHLIQSYANAQGITDEEIGGLYDHRFWMILHDAARYRQAETAGKKKVATTTKTAAPGSGKGVNQGNRHLRAERERLRTTGDERAAGNILQELMTRKK